LSNTNIKNRGWTQVLRKGNRCRSTSGTCRVQYTVLCIALYVCWFKIQCRVRHTLTYNSTGKNGNNFSLPQLDLKFSFLRKPYKLHGFLISDTWPAFYPASLSLHCIMKRKFKQGWSSIPTISAKQKKSPVILTELTEHKKDHDTLKIQVL